MKRLRLVARRTELNMSQEQAAAAVGVARTTYVRYETGSRTPSLEAARKIAAALQSTVDLLFGVDVPDRHTPPGGIDATAS